MFLLILLSISNYYKFCRFSLPENIYIVLYLQDINQFSECFINFFSFLQSSYAGAIQSNINRNDLVINAELTKLFLHIILGLIRVIIINDLPHSFIRVYHRLKIFLSMIYNKCSDEHPLIVILIFGNIFKEDVITSVKKDSIIVMPN